MSQLRSGCSLVSQYDAMEHSEKAFLIVKNLPANAGDMSLISGLERSPREGNGSPSQYACLGNPMDRRPWEATVHGVAKSQTELTD